MKKFSYNPQVRKEKRQELGIQDNTTVIGFVGRLEYQKNPQLLMRIFIEYHAANPDSILLVVGTGHLQDECETLILHAGISQSVIFLGARIDTASFIKLWMRFASIKI
uniref:Glycos_transf_1 n=1 Tax=uncultured Bifidobacterium sp. TaxID=165187 RepID=A0A060C3G7_9BIFI|nr:Glycos_transf_1 [uncultured Bifidobacterium sp.]